MIRWLMLAAVLGCAHASATVKGAIQCEDAKTTQLANEAAAEVFNALEHDNWTFVLADLAKKYGEPAIWCILDSEATSADVPTVTAKPSTVAKTRAQAWIKEHDAR